MGKMTNFECGRTQGQQAKDDLIQSGQGYLTADDKVFVQKRLSKIDGGHRSSVRNSVNRGQITPKSRNRDFLI
jgi:hypothetical protein